MVRLKLQKKKNKKYIQFIENVIEDCFTNRKIRVGFTYNRKLHEAEGIAIAIDKLNHMLIIDRNDAITILPIKNITYIEIIH
jgi:predicted nucleic acid-binding protein